MIAKKRIIRLIVVLCFGHIFPLMFAQTTTLSSIKAQLDHMFSGLDKTKVPTGYLWDTSVNLVEGEFYNGGALTDSNYVSLPLLGDMLKSINSASVGADTISVQAALSRIERNSSMQNAMVSILFHPYNYIVANALTDSLISYSNGIVSDVYNNGVWQNPYGTDVLFGYAIGNGGTVSQSVTYSFANVDSLSTLVFSSIQFDPGDGNGFRALSSNGECTLTYQETGYKETKLKMTVGGHIYQGHCLVFVKDSDPYLAPGSSSYVDSLEVSATYEGGTYRARVVHEATVSFNRRPIIVSEGFDPWRLYSDKTIHSYSGFTDIESIINRRYNSQYSFFSNYDVYYVDWYDCGADIRANAEVLKAVIRWVNSHNQSGEPNIVLGQSMGGLIARYALRDMELHNETHNTTLFISHDVPYLGANVSPGFLYAYWDLFDLTDNIFGLVYSLFGSRRKEFLALRDLGDAESVKQMLPNYLDDTWSYNNSKYQSLQNCLQQIGFPVGINNCPVENIAIVNGGKSSSGSLSSYSPLDTLINVDFKASTSVLAELALSAISIWTISNSIPFLWIPGKSTIKCEYRIYPYISNSCLVAESYASFTKKFLWLANWEHVLNNKPHFAPSTGTPLDNVGNSYYDTKVLDGDMPLDTTATSWWGTYQYTINKKDSIAFIPTASAMVMPGSGYSRDFYYSPPIPGTETPFTSYILQNNATKHISFFSDIDNWLGTVVGTSVSGPEVVPDSTMFQIVGPAASGSSFSWSTSDPRIATINSTTGVFHALSAGLVTVIAMDQRPGRVISKRKTVISKMPEMCLDYTNDSTSYTVTASFVDQDVLDYMQQCGLRDSVVFNWGVKRDSDSLMVSHLSSPSFTVQTSSADTVVTVYLSISIGNLQGRTYYLTVKRPNVFLRNVQTIRKRYPQGSIAYITDIFGFPFDSNKPPLLMIKKNPSAEANNITFSHIRYKDNNYYGTLSSWYPNGSTEPEYYISFDILLDTTLQRMLYFMTPDFSPTYITIDVYGFPYEFIERITIPIYCEDSSLPL